MVVFSLVMSEDMVKDGYEEIMNVDISTVAIDMMRRKHAHIPQLKCILAGCFFFLSCDCCYLKCSMFVF